jgi:glycosyltransferase involved in cell wall biosynthesis
VSVLSLATNNGSVGGGEVMLLRIAETARGLGIAVEVVGPSEPSELVGASRDEGFPTEVIQADGRRAYMRGLRAWDRGRSGLLWCNGLVPALATAGHPRRVVHLHQDPRGLQTIATHVARWRSELVIVPSTYMGTQVDRSTVLPNWTTDPVPLRPRPHHSAGAARVGFLGRFSQDKGVDVLAQAVRLLNERRREPVTLVLAGDYRFVPTEQAAAVRTALSEVADHVVDLGWVDREMFFSNIDLAVFPSVWAEPFGLVVAEAMAARVPFVISDAGALPEVAGPDHPWVASAGDPGSLSRVIDAALDAVPETATQASYERWRAEYSDDAGGRRVAALFHQLDILDPPRRHRP